MTLPQLVERSRSACRCPSACSRTVSSIERRSSPSSASLRTRLQPTSASRSRRNSRPAGASARASSSDALSAKTASVAVEQRAGSSRQALVAPVDRRAKRPLALGQVDRPLHLEREPFLERADDLGRREHHEPRGDELDGERQAVETAADLVHGRERVGSEDHAARSGELDEQRRGVLDGERLERQDVLRREAEWRAARRQDLEVGSAVEQLGHVGRRGRQVLEVVEEEERSGALQPCRRPRRARCGRRTRARRSRARSRSGRARHRGPARARRDGLAARALRGRRPRARAGSCRRRPAR